MPQPRRTANGAFHGRLKAGHQDWRWVEQAAAVPMQLSVTQVRPAGWRQHPIQPGLHKNEAVTGPPADRTTGLGDSEHRASPDSELDAHAAESGARAAQQGGLHPALQEMEPWCAASPRSSVSQNSRVVNAGR
jgi:hypothetical protein